MSLFLFITTILQVPGSKVMEKGIEVAASSVHQEINFILASLLVGILIVSGIVIRYLIKEKERVAQSVREDLAKEQAINEGAHQQVVKAKTEQIIFLSEENKELKQKYLQIVEDNTEVYRHLATKIGSFVEGQAVLAGQLEKIKSEIVVEIVKLYKNNS